MADPLDAGAAAAHRAPLAAARAGDPATTIIKARDLRDHLPGLEPERRLTDWGRSERVEGLVDRAVYDFLYHYWFRVEVEGIENVPGEGPALLLANHAGALAPDAAMIAKAIREEHPRARPVQFLVRRRLTEFPGLGMLLTKVGGIPHHDANLHRLLFDEGQLVLAFPEGAGGAQKPLKERYRLRRFEHLSLVDGAVRAGAPIIPVAVIGAEEAAPVLATLSRLTRLVNVPLAPPVPLPAKFRIRFLEPVDAGDRAHVAALAHDIRALIQENLLEMVAQRRSVWLG
jgi:1-acyl-sn-glycerol-3-phosphate acyltransferase